MATTVRVRPLDRPGDLGWVVMSHGDLYASELNWGPEFETLVARVIADFAAHHDPQREAGWIAEMNNVRVGCVLCVAHDAGTAQLRVLLVDPRARGHGLGRQLTNACTDFAREAGYRRIRLWTTTAQAVASRIYLAAGFVLVAEEPHSAFGIDVTAQTWELEL